MIILKIILLNKTCKMVLVEGTSVTLTCGFHPGWTLTSQTSLFLSCTFYRGFIFINLI